MYPLLIRPLFTITALLCVFCHEGVRAEGTRTQVDRKTFTESVAPFLQKHCTRCHGKDEAEAGLRLNLLGPKFVAGGPEARAWHEVMDRLNLGEMPPEGEPQPKQSEVDAVNRWIVTELRRAIANSRDGAGRVVLRRMNRHQYNSTIQDLLGINLRPADVFPADDTAHGFDNIGRALTMSPLLMEKYIAAAETVLDRAIVTGPQPRSVKRHAEIEDMSRFFTRQKTLRTFHSGFMVRSNDFLLMTRNKTFLPLIDSYKFSVPGEYAIRVRASGVRGGDYPPRMVILFDGVKVWEGDVTASEDAPQVYEVRIPVEPSASGTRRVVKVAYSNFDVQHTMPLALDYMEIEGPIYDQWPPRSHRQIFFKGLDAREDDPYAQEIISRFTEKAWRRPLKGDEIDRLVRLYKDQREQGSSFVDSIKASLIAVLCSHDFLFLVEPAASDPQHAKPRRLNDFELASRLSYFLWNSMPDALLFESARENRLHGPAELAKQVQRMLKDWRSQRFVKSFVAQWLQTRLVGSFPPDAKLYPNYDYHLETSMIRETEAFFAEILHSDLDVLNFIDSEFAMLNERIARHYGIGGVKGDQFRRVRLPSDSHRGGVMTHASILAGLSDGTRTKPIKRGVWILETLLGDPPPPPPPGAGEIEPNKKGAEALSLRDRMKLHRQVPACGSCHRKIDPLGFSLQNYDAIGAWRTHEEGVDEPIDSSGRLPSGTAFDGPDEFKQLLLQHKGAFYRCLAEKLLTYALGRGLVITDDALIDRLCQGLNEGDRLDDLIENIVNSETFQSK